MGGVFNFTEYEEEDEIQVEPISKNSLHRAINPVILGTAKYENKLGTETADNIEILG